MLQINSSQTDRCDAKRIGVVIVHGVGETELGYSINTLASALVDKHQYTFVPHSEIIPLVAKGAPEPIKPEFRAVRRHADHPNGAKLVFEELYWADLTDVPRGRVGILMGLFRVIFESHHLVGAMLDGSKNRATAVLRHALLAASWLMRGPLAAISISVMAVFGLLLYGPLPDPAQNDGCPGGLLHCIGNLDTSLKYRIVQGVLFAIAIICLCLIAQSKDIVWYDTIFWLAIVALGLFVLNFFGVQFSVLRLADSLNGEHSDPICTPHWGQPKCFVRVPYLLSLWGWIGWGLLIWFSIIIVLFSMIRANSGAVARPIASISASLGVIVLQFMMFTVVVVSFLFPMLNRGEFVTGLATKEVGTALITTLNSIDPGRTDPQIAPVRELISTPPLDLKLIGPFKFAFGATVASLIVALLIVGTVYFFRWLTAKHYSKKSIASITTAQSLLRKGAEQMPVLLFSPLLLAWLIFSVIVLMLIIAVDPSIYPEVAVWKPYLLAAAALAAVIVPFLLGPNAANVILIARNLIDHHYTPRNKWAQHFFPKYFNEPNEQPRRYRIQCRLTSMIEDMFCSNFDAVVFVAHSQGSVVVFDYLSQAPRPTELPNENVGLVTIGSPIGQIYEKYFYEYEEATQIVTIVERRMLKWTNLARIDDYVGGSIAAGRLSRIENVFLTRGGHTDYWDDVHVVKAVDDMVTACCKAVPSWIPRGW